MLNTPWNDSWSMPSVKSYAAQLISDAGGEYIYKKNTSHGAEPIGLETAYGLIREGKTYEEALAYFYPGTELISLIY